MKLTKSQLIALPVILAAGFFVRAYRLGNEGLWLDEGYAVKFASYDFLSILSNPENNPPLYFLTLHFWTGLFGNSELSIRMPSVIFGVLSIFMIYKLGSLMFNKSTGILSSLLLTLSAFHIAFSREARTYSLSVFLTLLSSYFFFILIHKLFPLKSGEFDKTAFDSKIKLTIAGYLLFSILLMYSHIFGLLIIVSQNIIFVSMLSAGRDRLKPALKTWCSMQIALIALFSPWIPIFMSRIDSVQKGFWIPAPDIQSILASFLSYSNGSMFLMFLFVALSFFSIISFKKASGGSYPAKLKSLQSCCIKTNLPYIGRIFFLLAWLFTPIILPLIISMLSTPIYHIKYTIVVLPAFYLLVANGIINVGNKYLKLFLIVIITVFAMKAVWWYHTTTHKQQWREAVDYIDKNAGTNDVLLFNSFIFKNLLFDYYSGRPDLVEKKMLIKNDFPERYRDSVDERYLLDLKKAVAGHDRVWLMLCQSGNNRDLIKKTILESHVISDQKKYIGIILYVFEAISLPEKKDGRLLVTPSEMRTRNGHMVGG